MTEGFDKQLLVTILSALKFRNEQDITYVGKNFDIVIKKGFEFDGASIPRFLWSIYGCPIGGSYSLPAMLHDLLYATHIFSKEYSDKIFRRAMIASGVSRRQAREMYMAVKLFGRSSYEEKTDMASQREYIEIIFKKENNDWIW